MCDSIPEGYIKFPINITESMYNNVTSHTKKEIKQKQKKNDFFYKSNVS